jgi:polyphosphate kinase
MERNLDRRVETLCPVRDRGLAAHIRTTVLEAYLQRSGEHVERRSVRAGAMRRPSGRVSAQRELLEWYTSRPHAHDLPLGSE